MLFGPSIKFYSKTNSLRIRGNNSKFLGLGTLRNFQIPVPSDAEVERINASLRDFTFRLDEEKRKLNKYQKIKRGLVADLLTGQTRVRVPSQADEEVAV